MSYYILQLLSYPVYNTKPFFIIINSICSEHGILKGTYGREKLTPLPYKIAQAIGIIYKSMDKKKSITLGEAGSYMYQEGRISQVAIAKITARYLPLVNA